ncbi:uncharacterized protein LOC131953060 [Physella acuta]|uniref:uncharacterized protein LOC131953060 n=1 Tax=Physella acuta TaxID=109671 RepID=UPI0027DC9348|nr:uncharacterized protein LOC131953060 [Physella acuta]
MSARMVVLFSLVVTCLPRHDSGLPQNGIAVMFVNSTDYTTHLVVPILFNYSTFSDFYDCLQSGHDSCGGHYNNGSVSNVYHIGEVSNSSHICYYCMAWYNQHNFTCERREFNDNSSDLNVFSFSFIDESCVHLVKTHCGEYITFVGINITSCMNSASTGCVKRTNVVDQTSTEPFLTGEQVSSGDITDEQTSIRSTSIVQSTSAVTPETVNDTDKITTKSSLTKEQFSSSDITHEQSSVSSTSIVQSTSALKIETIYDTDKITAKSSLTEEQFFSSDSTVRQFTVRYTSKEQSTSAVQSQPVADPTIIAVSVTIPCVIFIIVILVLICTRKALIRKLRTHRNTKQCTEASTLHTVNIDLPASDSVQANIIHELSQCKYTFNEKPNENQNASTHESIITTSLDDAPNLETENTGIALYNNIQNNSSVVYTNVEGTNDNGSCIRTYNKNVEAHTLLEDLDGQNSGTVYSKLGEIKRVADNPYNKLASVEGVCDGL